MQQIYVPKKALKWLKKQNLREAEFVQSVSKCLDGHVFGKTVSKIP